MSYQESYRVFMLNQIKKQQENEKIVEDHYKRFGHYHCFSVASFMPGGKSVIDRIKECEKKHDIASSSRCGSNTRS